MVTDTSAKNVGVWTGCFGFSFHRETEFGFNVKKIMRLQIPFSKQMIGSNKYEVKESEVPVKPDFGLLAIKL